MSLHVEGCESLISSSEVLISQRSMSYAQKQL